MVIGIDGSEHAQLKSLLDVAVSVIKEQVVHIDRFNILRYTHTNQPCISVHYNSFCMPLMFITNFMYLLQSFWRCWYLERGAR